MPNHYVIGDVHGCYDSMIELINKIESMDPGAQIIFVGDFIDRGPQVNKVLEWSLENISPNGRYRSVRGNHEELALEWYGKFLNWWDDLCINGYTDALMPESDFDFSIWLEAMQKLNPESLKPYMDFFESLPLSLEVKVNTVSGREQVYRIVHASYDFSPDISEGDQKSINLWKRRMDGNYVNDDIVVHGHMPTISSAYTNEIYGKSHPGMICYTKNDINVDGGHVYSDGFPQFPTYLCAIRLEDLQEIYAVGLEERFIEKSKNADVARRYMDEYIDSYFSQKNEYRSEMLKRVRGQENL